MTQEEHAKLIGAAIDAAVADGLHVEITNSCCGCSRMALEIGPADVDWSGSSDSVTTVIIGEQE